MSMMKSTSRRKPGPETTAGVAAIEFALLAPLLVVLLIGVVEIGLAAYQDMEVQNAAEAGALYAVRNGFDPDGIETAMENATGLSGVTAGAAPLSFCGCPGLDGVTVISCDFTCPGGDAPGDYVKVEASFEHHTILPYPWVSSPVVLTGESTVRLK
ncbi:TadE/TadG family type IV pilus assembly protein [Hyphococcus luteus]|uniref:Pilus assembly protein n=1 Tax=Hyphococcus luteus TaxID=2058213 RepID=A0A2S7K5X7_9PROT|nr:TadE/TadG family type IV pilus assembly protein [Marinicaulis flavus]PQA87889.1 pilus assembly protein [Marinicaulis flavus]